MDSFIPKGGRIDTVRSARPSKSPRVTREDGSHGNKRGQKDHDPVDQIDIDPTHLEENSQNHEAGSSERPKTSTISLKMIRDAMIAQATKTVPSLEADPDYKRALSAYGTYSSITAPPPELQNTDEQGHKTKFGKLSDLIDHGMDHVAVNRGQSYDDLIVTLWNQEFTTS